MEEQQKKVETIPFVVEKPKRSFAYNLVVAIILIPALVALVLLVWPREEEFCVNGYDDAVCYTKMYIMGRFERLGSSQSTCHNYMFGNCNMYGHDGLFSKYECVAQKVGITQEEYDAKVKACHVLEVVEDNDYVVGEGLSRKGNYLYNNFDTRYYWTFEQWIEKQGFSDLQSLFGMDEEKLKQLYSDFQTELYYYVVRCIDKCRADGDCWNNRNMIKKYHYRLEYLVNSQKKLSEAMSDYAQANFDANNKSGYTFDGVPEIVFQAYRRYANYLLTNLRNGNYMYPGSIVMLKEFQEAVAKSGSTYEDFGITEVELPCLTMKDPTLPECRVKTVVVMRDED